MWKKSQNNNNQFLIDHQQLDMEDLVVDILDMVSKDMDILVWVSLVMDIQEWVIQEWEEWDSLVMVVMDVDFLVSWPQDLQHKM